MASSRGDEDDGEPPQRAGSRASHGRAARSPASRPRFEDVFVGRDADLSTLSALVAGGERLITIVVPPGIGKTRLARAAAPDRR